MLELDMELEAGLGIDSIKRVQILSAVKQAAPGLGEVDAKHLGTLRTLREIVEYMQQTAPATNNVVHANQSTVAAPANAVNSQALKELMLRTVAEKTGYPVEMLELDMELEAGLGIDSIKRVQILSAVKQAAPGLGEIDAKHLGTLRTLGEIVAYLEGGAATPSAIVRPDAEVVSQPKQLPAKVGRFALKVENALAAGFAIAGLSQAKRIVITEDGRGVAQALAALFARHGYPAVAATEIPGDADVVISLAGLRAVSDVAAAIAVNREVFAQARSVADRFGNGKTRGIFITVQDCGGDFGLTTIDTPARAILGGIAGLTKTAAREWPSCSVKAIDIARAHRSAEEIAEALFAELTTGGPGVEVGLRADGSRVVPVSYADELDSSSESGLTYVDQNSVIVATGGARGVTAHTLIALAKQYRPRLALLGRTPVQEDEPAELQNAHDDAALKKALLEMANQNGEKLSPLELNKRTGEIQANREVRTTLAALRAAGADARYFATDVTHAAELTATLDQIRAGWGPITGLVHGAGVLADKLIAQKTLEQFDRVFNTKVDGLLGLLNATQADPLRYICLFSSVAARGGNPGQCDYAMANEILNKIATVEARWRGPNCLVKSMNWGPWEGGMVSPELKRQFEAMGVPLIPLDVGAQMLVDEIRFARPEQVEVVLGGSPNLKPAVPDPASSGPDYECEIHLAPANYGFLNSHKVRGVPVVPVALVIEWAMRAAQAYRPELVATACRDVQMLQGIRLPDFERGTIIRLALRESVLNESLECIISAQNGTPHYKCTVELAKILRLPVGDAPDGDAAAKTKAPDGLTPWSFSENEIYGERLFHGPDFQVIRCLDGISNASAAAQIDRAKGAEWGDIAWRTDVAMIDGGLQLALLWTSHLLAKHNLPTGVAQYIPYRNDVTRPGRVRCILRGNATPDRLQTKSDLVFVAEDGALLAELRGVEMHVIADA